MTAFHTTDWFAQARADFTAALRSHMKTLLEQKHLYQSVTVDLTNVMQRAASTSSSNRSMFEEEVQRAASALWTPVEPRLPGVAAQAHNVIGRIALAFPTIKTFCRRCNRVEAHNSVFAQDVVSNLAARGIRSYDPPTLQAFVVGYLCQGCKVTPEFFMIRREQLKLSIVGRSPIEHLDVPQVIPKNQRKYYAGAVVAAQSGQILPALFMLRTFLEQFAASQVADPSLRADAVIEVYMTSLPDALRSHFTSPREMYSRLSEAIHAAREDVSLYEEIIAQIVEHFEARRLYKVPTA